MNERQGKNAGGNAALHDALYQQITSSRIVVGVFADVPVSEGHRER
jgi:hypothetical protein